MATNQLAQGAGVFMTFMILIYAAAVCVALITRWRRVGSTDSHQDY